MQQRMLLIISFRSTLVTMLRQLALSVAVAQCLCAFSALSVNDLHALLILVETEATLATAKEHEPFPSLEPKSSSADTSLSKTRSSLA